MAKASLPVSEERKQKLREELRNSLTPPSIHHSGGRVRKEDVHLQCEGIVVRPVVLSATGAFPLALSSYSFLTLSEMHLPSIPPSP